MSAYMPDLGGLSAPQLALYAAIERGEVTAHAGHKLNTARSLERRGLAVVSVDSSGGFWVARMPTETERVAANCRDINMRLIKVGSVVAYCTGFTSYTIGIVKSIFPDLEAGTIDLELSNNDSRLTHSGWYVDAASVMVVDVPGLYPGLYPKGA